MAIYAIRWHIYLMAGHATRSRIERLDQLQGLLKARDTIVLADLASELNVSRRTIARDLSLLRERGVPIEGDRGRGGGLRLDRAWSIGRLQLTYQEAVDALLAFAIAQQLQLPLLLTSIDAIRRKIAAAFPRAEESRIRMLRRRILVGGPASIAVVGSYVAPAPFLLPDIASSFFQMKTVKILYEDSAGRRSVRTVEPHFLLLNAPVWYLLAWDSLRDGIRCFRIDRIRSAKIGDETFRLGRKDSFFMEADEQLREI